jgi:hypothetical protein
MEQSEEPWRFLSSVLVVLHHYVVSLKEHYNCNLNRIFFVERSLELNGFSALVMAHSTNTQCGSRNLEVS